MKRRLFSLALVVAMLLAALPAAMLPAAASENSITLPHDPPPRTASGTWGAGWTAGQGGFGLTSAILGAAIRLEVTMREPADASALASSGGLAVYLHWSNVFMENNTPVGNVFTWDLRSHRGTLVSNGFIDLGHSWWNTDWTWSVLRSRIQSVVLFYEADPDPFVSLNPQAGRLMTGTPGSATYSLLTMGVPAGTYNNPTFTPSLPAGTTGSVTVNANRSGTLTIATNASTPPRVTAHTITLNGVTSLPFDLRVDGISGVLSPGEYTFPVPPPVLNITMGQWDDVTTPDLTAAILKDSYRLEVAVSAQIPAGVALYMCTPDDEWSTNEILGVFENGKYIWEFTPSKMAEFTSSPFSFRFRIGRAGVQFNDLGIQSIKLFFTDKKITVGAQNGTLTAGIPGFVTYPVTTENIPNGTYSAAVRNLPFGMGIMFGSVTINNNSGTLTLQTGTAARAIIRNNLALVIDGITSTNFGIAIAAANYGDIDGDGKIDAADITLLRRYVAANDKELFLEQNPRFNLINADVTGNNNIGAADVARLRQYVAGYDVALGKPVEVEDWQYLIALTFDDGPNNDTITILDKFEELGAVGSFFVNAGLINAGNIPTLQRAVALGNDIENHGMTHTDMNTMSASAIIAEINQAADVIEAAVGIRSRYFRPPFFGIGNHMIGADVTTNHPFIFSNLDTKDYENTSAHIINFMLTNAADGAADGGIVLFHDNPQTAASLEHFIPQMKAMGYKFVTVRELYEMRAATPTWYTGGAWPNTHVK